MNNKMRTIMKKVWIILMLQILLLGCSNNINNTSKIISRANGNIIFTYQGFEEFLNSDKTWDNYTSKILTPFPTMRSLHERYLKYGFIDSSLYKKEVANYAIEDYNQYLKRVDEEKLIQLYDSVIAKMDKLISPLDSTDLCFFLPYGKDCFIQNVSGRKTIYISIKYKPEEMPLILIHEYAHSLHYQRRPKESTTLAKWVVEEGIASYIPTLISNDYSIYEGLWMMSKENVDWCISHEQNIRDSIWVDIDMSDMETDKKYRAGGEGFSNPPKGFPEKTAYYMGYRAIEECLKKGYTLSDICSLDSKSVIEISNVFNNNQSSSIPK
jgi:uncharacterized protein YjaZ